MIPIRDINPRRTTPWVTWGLVATNVAFFIWELSLGASLPREMMRAGFIPERFWVSGHWIFDTRSMFLSMFLHGGLLHIGGNMLYLWIFGDNVEDRMGHGRYLAFYFLCGIAAALSHALANPSSNMPAIGASGAIAGVLAAYLVLFPHAKVMTFIPVGFFIFLREIPAIIVLGFWFLLQLFTGAMSLGIPSGASQGGVAWFAHIGGFVAGLALVFLFAKAPEKRRDDWDVL